MAQLKHGDTYQVVYSGGNWIITTNDTYAADDIIHIGVDPQGSSGTTLLPINFNQQKRISHTNIRR